MYLEIIRKLTVKRASILLLFTLFPFLGIHGESKSPVSFDGTTFISTGIVTSSSESEYSDDAQFWESVFSIRVGASLSMLYRLTDEFSVGAEAGMAFMGLDFIGIDHLFFDFPVNAVIRYGSEDTFLESFIGYYFSNGLSSGAMDERIKLRNKVSYHGINVGLKASYEGFFLSASYVFGGDINYIRFTIGNNWI